MTKPSQLTGTYCLALPGTKPLKLLIPSDSSSAKASGPDTYRSVMWYDWLNSTAVFCQAHCSSRQLVYSGSLTG